MLRWHQTAIWLSLGPLLVGRGSILVLSISNLLLCLCLVSFVSNLCFVLCLIKVTSLHYILRDVVDVQPVWPICWKIVFWNLSFRFSSQIILAYKIIQTALHIVLEIAASRSTTMVSTIIYYIVRQSIFFLIVLAPKFQHLICLSSSNSFQVFSYSLMMDGCIHDGLISNIPAAHWFVVF